MPNLSYETRQLVLDLVRASILEDGSFASEVINQATVSVKEFSDKQKHYSAHYGVILTNLVDAISKSDPSLLNKCGNFSKDQVLALLKSSIGGTPAWEELAKNLEYKAPESYGGLLRDDKVI